MATEILSKYVLPGSKIDIRVTRKKKGEDEQEETKYYQSNVYDVLSEDRIEVVMPMEKAKIVLLPVGGVYDLFFYTDTSIYQCRARIVDREKKDNIYLLTMDLISNLRKHQRREYYRFSCALEMSARPLEEKEITSMEEEGMKKEMVVPELPLKRSIIVDISGGGLRFVSDYKYETESIVLCKYRLDTYEGVKILEVLGKVLSVKELENREGMFEHRIQYINIEDEVREEIIKYIFEEERKNLKKKDKL